MALTTTEKVGVIIGSVGSLLGILGSVWYAAISFNTLSESIHRNSNEMQWVREAIAEKDEAHEEFEDDIEDGERRIATLESMTFERVYVNHTFTVLKYKEDGETLFIKIPSERISPKG